MTHSLKTTLLRFITIFAVSLFLLFLAKSVHAQTPTDDVTAKFGITFPISEFGDCNDYASCRSFCDDPVNLTTCNEFAKKKGFYKEDKSLTSGKFIDSAKNDLGCDSAQSCKEVCQKQENFEKCNNFAKKLDLSGGYVRSPGDSKVLEKAKEALGCDSTGSCANFCQQEGNRQKCADFARQTGLRGGEQLRGPGGCATEGTCRSFCLDPANFNECSKFTPAQIGKFKGPGGCDSADSCRTYCEQNSASCRSYAPGSNGRYVPTACPQNQFFGPGGACTPQEKSQDAANCAKDGKFWNGNNCEERPPAGIINAGQSVFTQRTDMGNCSTPGSCYDWCKANPGKCQGFNPDNPRPVDPIYSNQTQYSGSVQTTPGTSNTSATNNTMQSNPSMGGCSSPGACYDWCKANPGKCGGFNPDSPRPTENNYQAPSNYTPPSSSQPAPQPTEQPQQQPQPTTSTTPVMGVKTGILDSIISFFTGLFK